MVWTVLSSRNRWGLGRAGAKSRATTLRLNYPPRHMGWPSATGSDGKRVPRRSGRWRRHVRADRRAGACCALEGIRRYPRDRTQRQGAATKAVEYHGAHADPALAQAHPSPAPISACRPSPSAAQVREAQHGAEGWQRLYKIAVPRLALLPFMGAQDRRSARSRTACVAAARSRPQAISRTASALDRRDRAGAQDRAGEWPRRVGRLPLALAALLRSRQIPPARAASIIPLEEIDFTRTQGQAHSACWACSRRAIDNASPRRSKPVRRGDLLRAASAPAAGQQVEGRIVSRLPARPGMLDDDWRWKIYTYMLAAGSPPPRIRCCGRTRAAGLRLPLRRTVARHERRQGRRRRKDLQGHGALRRRADRHRLRRRSRPRPELASFSPNVDFVGPPAHAQTRRRPTPKLRAIPISAPASSWSEKVPGRTPHMGDIHLFNWGSILSHGALAGDIPGLFVGATRLVQATLACAVPRRTSSGMCRTCSLRKTRTRTDRLFRAARKTIRHALKEEETCRRIMSS